MIFFFIKNEKRNENLYKWKRWERKKEMLHCWEERDNKTYL